jgi:hypothetical protein
MTNFMTQVIGELRVILSNEGGAAHRLGLSAGIVNGWRGYLASKSPDEMARLVNEVCEGNKIPLAQYEASGQPRQAAEMILGTVDGFLRQTLGVEN